MLGTVSGSGVATTVTVASIAWPMLKKSGYKPEIAGGMLAASGIGATLSPPTLGAAAFIIAEYLDVEYLEVLIYATIPTLLYYIACWITTEADAKKLGIKPIKTSNESLIKLTLSQGYHFLSLAAIAVFLAMGFTSFMAVFWSIAIAFALSMLKPESRLVSLDAFGFGVAITIALELFTDTRLSEAVFWGMAVATAWSGASWLWGRNKTPEAIRMIEALRDGAKSTLGIVATCACAGIIVSVVNLTGLGLTISGMIVQFGGGERLITILLAALAMWVLGLAVPVTASYIIAAVMLVPALTKVGIPEPAAHMFMFYYAVLADVSPPTALAPFAAAAITGGRPFATMLQAWKYTLPAFLVPIIFCLTPEGMRLLMFTPDALWPETLTDWLGIAWTTMNAALALIGLSIAMTGYAFGRANSLERLAFALAGCLLLTSDTTLDIIGLGLLAMVFTAHIFRSSRKTKPL